MRYEGAYPARLTLDYPERELNRVSTLFRVFAAIPILVVLGTVSGEVWEWSYGDGKTAVAAAGGLLFFGPLLMILFRQKYPRWWFDFNLQLTRFSTRVTTYMALMSDGYPSSDEEQWVHLDLDYPDVKQELNRWMPLVKWFLAIPHYIVLIFLTIGAFFAVVLAWFSILFTGRYPRTLFEYVEGVMRWWLRVEAYAMLLTTDRYPPFRLAA
jgi:roadblock/LC7 domain-containing protein